MGEVIEVRCSACRSSWQCFTGTGLAYGWKENIIDAFPERERAEVFQRMARSQIPAYDFSYRPVVCGFCKKVVSVPVLAEITEGEGAYVGGCPRCGKKTGKPDPVWEQTSCPVCGSRSLCAEESGQWD